MDITRTWSQVDLETMKKNLDAIQSCVSEGMDVRELVSANAYTFTPAVGGPMQGICPPFLSVETIEEGCTLRSRGVTVPILVRKYPRPDSVTACVKTLHRNYLSLSLDNLDDFKAVSARVIPIFGGLLAIHLKVVIGSSEGDFSCLDETSPIDNLVLVKSTLGLFCQGIYTELDPDESEEEKMRKVRVLHRIADRLEEISGKKIPIRHVFLKD